MFPTSLTQGAAGGAGGLGALAGATPYGAAIGAAAGLATAALEDKPSNTTSGSGSYQAGPFTVGNKQVGGKGNQAGATTATASQTPMSEGAAAPGGRSQTTLYVIIGAAVALILGGMFAFSRRK